MLLQKAPGFSTANIGNISKMISGNEKYSQETVNFLKKYKEEVLITSSRENETDATFRQNGYGECLSTSVSHRGLEKNTATKKSFQNDELTFVVNLKEKNLSYLSKLELPRNIEQIHLLDVSNNQLIDTPHVLLTMTSLRNLRLDGNSLRSWPPILCERLMLESFSISDNLLSSIPENVGLWKDCLQFLNLEKNLIENIPVSLGSLHRLRCLYLAQNHFLSIPTSFKNLKNLAELSLDWFKYTSPGLPEKVQGQTGLKLLGSLWQLCESTEQTKERAEAKAKTPKSCKNGDAEKKGKDEKGNKTRAIFDFFKNKIRASVEQKKTTRQQEVLKTSKSCEGLPKVLPKENREINNNIDFLAFARNFSTRDFDFKMILQDNQTLYHKAVSEGDIGMLRILLKYIPECKDNLDDQEISPLLMAIRTEKYQAAKVLISNGADSQRNCKEPCLILAIKKMQYFLIQDLLRFGADPNLGDEEGNTSMHFLFAMFTTDPNLFSLIGELLLKFGANPNKRNNERWSPVHLAVKLNQSDSIKWITESGQQYFINENLKFKIDKRGGQEGWTALHMATILNYKKMANFLLEKGADIFAVNLKNKTPKDLAFSDPLLLRMLRKAEKNAIYKEVTSKLVKEKPEFIYIVNLSEIGEMEPNDTGSLFDNYSQLNKNTQDKKMNSKRPNFLTSVSSLSLRNPSTYSVAIKDSSEEEEDDLFSDVNENPSEFNIFENDAEFFANKMKQFRFDANNFNKLEKINEILQNIEKEQLEFKSARRKAVGVNPNFSKVNPKKYKCLARNLKMNSELVERHSNQLVALLKDRALPVSEKISLFNTLKSMVFKKRLVRDQFFLEKESIERNCKSMQLSLDNYERIYEVCIKEDADAESRKNEEDLMTFCKSDSAFHSRDPFLEKCLALITESDDFHLDVKSRAILSSCLSNTLHFYLKDLAPHEQVLKNRLKCPDELLVMRYEILQIWELLGRKKKFSSALK